MSITTPNPSFLVSNWITSLHWVWQLLQHRAVSHKTHSEADNRLNCLPWWYVWHSVFYQPGGGTAESVVCFTVCLVGHCPMLKQLPDSMQWCYLVILRRRERWTRFVGIVMLHMYEHSYYLHTAGTHYHNYIHTLWCWVLTLRGGGKVVWRCAPIPANKNPHIHTHTHTHTHTC